MCRGVAKTFQRGRGECNIVTDPGYSSYCLLDVLAVFLEKCHFFGWAASVRGGKSLRDSSIDDVRSEKDWICCLYKDADENTLIRKNIQQTEPSNDGFCERNTSSDNRKGKGVKGSQATPLTYQLKSIVIRRKYIFLFIGREPTTWPANNCLQIMVCSCAMSSNSVWLRVILCSYVNETRFFSLLRSLLRENDRSLHK